MRADLLLVERGLAPSRTAAQRLIAGGHVYALAGSARNAISKPSIEVTNDARIEIDASELSRYVSRGGLKLEGALNHVVLDVGNLVCLDVGQSTGGFTDCLLQRGAKHVVGVDVGHDQLHASLRNDERVTFIEGVNAREMTLASVAAVCRDRASARMKLHGQEPHPRPNTHLEGEGTLGATSRSYSLAMEHGFDLIVADVSFISLTKVLPQWRTMLNETGRVLSLVKPQFEVGADNLARGGIVRDESLFANVEATIRKSCAENRLKVLDYFSSLITGADGNREFFVYAMRAK